MGVASEFTDGVNMLLHCFLASREGSVRILVEYHFYELSIQVFTLSASPAVEFGWDLGGPPAVHKRLWTRAKVMCTEEKMQCKGTCTARCILRQRLLRSFLLIRHGNYRMMLS